MAAVVRYLVTALVLLVDLVVSQVVNVNWRVNPESSTLRCIGGRVVGLTNTTVRLQYRTISTTSVIGDWITVDALPVNISSAVTHNLNYDSTVGDVQFRSLQLSPPPFPSPFPSPPPSPLPPYMEKLT